MNTKAPAKVVLDHWRYAQILGKRAGLAARRGDHDEAARQRAIWQALVHGTNDGRAAMLALVEHYIPSLSEEMQLWSCPDFIRHYTLTEMLKQARKSGRWDYPGRPRTWELVKPNWGIGSVCSYGEVAHVRDRAFNEAVAEGHTMEGDESAIDDTLSEHALPLPATPEEARRMAQLPGRHALLELASFLNCPGRAALASLDSPAAIAQAMKAACDAGNDDTALPERN
jgi:hypothetical protein